jgi:hypothetical protein
MLHFAGGSDGLASGVVIPLRSMITAGVLKRKHVRKYCCCHHRTSITIHQKTQWLSESAQKLMLTQSRECA